MLVEWLINQLTQVRLLMAVQFKLKRMITEAEGLKVGDVFDKKAINQWVQFNFFEDRLYILGSGWYKYSPSFKTQKDTHAIATFIATDDGFLFNLCLANDFIFIRAKGFKYFYENIYLKGKKEWYPIKGEMVTFSNAPFENSSGLILPFEGKFNEWWMAKRGLEHAPIAFRYMKQVIPITTVTEEELLKVYSNLKGIPLESLKIRK